MKKLLTCLFLLSMFTISAKVEAALTFDQAISQNKPSAVLIYADWADNLAAVNNSFDTLSQQYANKYNFLKINIASKDAKSFNKTNYIYPNLPYVLLFKERGRMSRCITHDCIMNNSCAKEKLDFFAN